MEIDGSFYVTVDRTAWGDISLTAVTTCGSLWTRWKQRGSAGMCGRRWVTVRRQMMDVRHSLRQPNAYALNCRPSRPVAAHRDRFPGHPLKAHVG